MIGEGAEAFTFYVVKEEVVSRVNHHDDIIPAGSIAIYDKALDDYDYEEPGPDLYCPSAQCHPDFLKYILFSELEDHIRLMTPFEKMQIVVAHRTMMNRLWRQAIKRI
jgi:hypothetical protein